MKSSSRFLLIFLFSIGISFQINAQVKTKTFYKAIVLTFFYLIFSLDSFSQLKNIKKDLGISIPVIWNNSEATYYQLGSAKHPSGNALSYGLNINYSQSFYKGIYVKIGVGYFNQCFHIKRPFNYYPNPGQILYSTQSYNYSNVQLMVGIGYCKKVSENLILNGCISYNYFNSFNQKYIHNNKVRQINKKSFPLGETVNFDLAIERKINKKISLALGIILPIYTYWNNDKTFINNHYSPDEQQIAINKFSSGISLSCYYHF